MNMKRYIGVLIIAIMAITLLLPQLALAQDQVEVPPESTAEMTPDATTDPNVTEEWSDPDYDGDGFLNDEDQCPWAGNEGGLGVDEVGCPYYDTDWDGFFDRNDECPWQGDEGGLGVDEVGCPYYDADWDGFYDRVDECPWQGDEYGAGVDGVGCPIPWDDVYGTEDPWSTEDPYSTEEPTATEPTATEPTATEPTATQPTATQPTPTQQTPTPPPPPRNECPADIVFMIDQSSSVNPTEFGLQQTFVLKALAALPIGPNGANVGVGYFGSTDTTGLIINGFDIGGNPVSYDGSMTDDGVALAAAVSGYSQIPGLTDTGQAIIEAQAELANNGRPGIKNIIIVVTDGDAFGLTYTEPLGPSETAQTAGTTLYAVGLYETDINDQSDLEFSTLLEIAGDSDNLVPDTDLIRQRTFATVNEPGFADGLMSDVCPDPEPLPPVAVDDVYYMNQGEVLDVTAPGLLANDYDYDDDAFEVVDWTDPVVGVLEFNTFDGAFTYTPPADFTGEVTFLYWIGDDEFDSENPAVVTIHVLGAEVTEEPTPTEPTATEPTPTEPTATEPTPEVTPDETEDPYATEDPYGTEEWSDPDYDGDGYLNDEDSCPWLGDEGGLGVDETGCPYYDADWDGFYDRDDECPWQGDEGGLGVDETGCPYYDADWDGFYDRDDACPWQADEYGTGIDATGCPNPEIDWDATEEAYVTEEWSDPDYDGDGFPNAEDQCPYAGNEGGLGTDTYGCPYYDADWDGVYDRDDECRYRGNEYGLGITETGCPVEPGTGSATEEPYVTQEPVANPQ